MKREQVRELALSMGYELVPKLVPNVVPKCKVCGGPAEPDGEWCKPSDPCFDHPFEAERGGAMTVQDEEAFTGKCPTCGQEYLKDRAEAAESRIDDLSRELTAEIEAHRVTRERLREERERCAAKCDELGALYDNDKQGAATCRELAMIIRSGA